MVYNISLITGVKVSEQCDKRILFSNRHKSIEKDGIQIFSMKKYTENLRMTQMIDQKK